MRSARTHVLFFCSAALVLCQSPRMRSRRAASATGKVSRHPHALRLAHRHAATPIRRSRTSRRCEPPRHDRAGPQPSRRPRLLRQRGTPLRRHRLRRRSPATTPRDTESAQMRGLTLFRLGRPADAIPLLESSREGPLSKADPNYVLALCYMDTRRYDDARHAFATQYGFAAG